MKNERRRTTAEDEKGNIKIVKQATRVKGKTKKLLER